MKRMYFQLNYVVTLTVGNKFVTECLSIDNKKFPMLDKYIDYEINGIYDVSDDVVALRLKDAARDWYDTSDISIINFWYQSTDIGWFDENGNVTF